MMHFAPKFNPNEFMELIDSQIPVETPPAAASAGTGASTSATGQLYVKWDQMAVDCFPLTSISAQSSI